MIRGKFKELLLQVLGKNNPEFSIDPRVALAVAEGVAIDLMAQMIAAKRSLPASFFQAQIVTVQHDSVRGLHYICPSPGIVSLADNAAIRKIAPKKDQFTDFILTEAGGLSNLSGMEASSLGGRTAAWQEAEKIWLYNLHFLCKDVLLIAIPRLTEVPDDEEVFGDSELEAKIIAGTIQQLMLKRQVVEDKTDDNRSN